MLERFRKSLKMAGLILLIALSLSGIGLPGVKIPTRHRKEDEQEQVDTNAQTNQKPGETIPFG